MNFNLILWGKGKEFNGMAHSQNWTILYDVKALIPLPTLSRIFLNNFPKCFLSCQLPFTFVPAIHKTHEQTAAPYRRRRRNTYQSAAAFAILAARTASQGQEEMLQKAQERQALQEMPGAVGMSYE
ncbi:MAG: hypothetical protein IT258_20815 [Saprospiraceae bacterium]|nr:hypothetical protein [Saprospiraceae bacterium]